MRNLIPHLFWIVLLFFFTASQAQDQSKPLRRFKVFVFGSSDKNHSPMVKKSIPVFQKMADENNFELHFTRDTAELTPAILLNYDVFVQLSIAYFDFSQRKQFAIQQFINSGRGWIGIHGAGLTGKQFSSKKRVDWIWYWHLLGDAYYIPHPPLQNGVVKVENREHPVTKNLPASFSLRDEWYEFENAPTNVNVLAVADESTYKPRKPMGYHPVIWTNPAYNRVLYISVGHDTTSCDSEPYKILLRDAIKWAGSDEAKSRMSSVSEKEVSVIVDKEGYNIEHPKTAVLQSNFSLGDESTFKIIDAMTLDSVFTGKVGPATKVKKKNVWTSSIDFSGFSKPGFYNIQVLANKKVYNSPDFEIGKHVLTNKSLENQRANAKQKLVTSPKFKAIVLTEHGDQHESFVVAGLDWIKQYSQKENFEFIEINNPDTLSEEFLKNYKLFIQLNYPPYRWSDKSKAAFEDYIDNGKGSWIGFHHASLLGKFDGYEMWPWFSDFLGGIRFKNYVAARADGEVYIEKKRHPIFKGLPSHFNLPGEEWYTFDKNPREKTEVLANVDENTYKPTTEIKMGDHPVIWSNPDKKAKNIYFLFGHHGGLFQVKEFEQLLDNTVKWAVNGK